MTAGTGESSDLALLLRRARAEYGVPAAERVEEMAAFLAGLGAVPIDFDRYWESLADEFVDPELVVSAVTILDPALFQQCGTRFDREYVDDQPDEEFDPLDYGPDQVEWTTWSHEIETGARLIVLIERDPNDPGRTGHCRVLGAGQWLREALWAATGVLPRDPGAPASGEAELYGDAFELAGRERFMAAPIPGR